LAEKRWVRNRLIDGCSVPRIKGSACRVVTSWLRTQGQYLSPRVLSCPFEIEAPLGTSPKGVSYPRYSQ